MRRIPREQDARVTVVFQSETQLILLVSMENGSSMSVDIGGPVNRRPLDDWPDNKVLLLAAEIQGVGA